MARLIDGPLAGTNVDLGRVSGIKWKTFRYLGPDGELCGGIQNAKVFNYEYELIDGTDDYKFVKEVLNVEHQKVGD